MKKKNEKSGKMSILDKNGKFDFGKCVNWKAVNNLSKEESKAVWDILKKVK